MKQLLTGYATVEATSAYFKTFSRIDHTHTRDGIAISRAGFGSYRVGQTDPEHREALKAALTQGINLIDTSTNYMNGQAETVIGEVLAELCAQQDLSRDQFVVVTKLGYIQGDLLQSLREKSESGDYYPECVHMNDQLLHCIHPKFIEDQITESLKRLGCDCLDIVLLHNPEYFLSHANEQNRELSESRTEYYTRIIKACKALEEQVKKGRIRGYGISSNTFSVREDEIGFTALDHICEWIEEAIPNHHFSCVQMPLNLLESGAAVEKNQAQDKTVLDVAEEHQLTVLINRPLNAFYDDKLIRLAHFQINRPTKEGEVLERIEQLLELGEEFYNEIFPNLYHIASEKQLLDELFGAVMTLKDYIPQIDSFVQWKDIMKHYFYPRIDVVVHQLVENEESQELQEWVTQYLHEMEPFFELASNYFKEKSNQKSNAIYELVSRTTQDWVVNKSLSETAIRAVRSTVGVSSVLVGMRQPKYVTEVVEEISQLIEQKDYSSIWTILGAF